MEEVYRAYYNSPIGLIEVKSCGEYITDLNFVEKEERVEFIPPSLKACIHQLDEYFRGERMSFSVKLKLQGTDFQKKVWNELIKIPYGQTVTYGYIAERIGNSKASRAVGNANNKNKISIIIPCHRVIGSSGKLIGYGGGLWRKEWLLQHEKK